MNEQPIERCPECEDLVQGEALHRRDFFRVVGSAAALAATAGILPAVARADSEAPKKAVKPAEDLVKELYSTLTDTQKKTIVLPWDEAGPRGVPTRMGMYNAPLKGQRLGQVYTKAQQDLLNQILRSILADEEAYKRISRNNGWDQRGGFESCGAHIFGEPTDGKKFAWLLTGHHLTLRCDGNSLEGAAFGGPMYYGHSANGYSEGNVYYYQTKSVLAVFKSLDAKQKEKAIVGGTPGEQAGSIALRKQTAGMPGISCTELTAEQKVLVENVLKSILSPYRKEDAGEVLEILKANGGLDKLHLAYYRDGRMNDNERWHFWRLEGPGFVWNYRTLPHVHCYVNIAATMG